VDLIDEWAQAQARVVALVAPLTVEQAARRADEGPAFAIFLIARLLADEGDVGADRPLAQNRVIGARRERL